MAFKLKTKNLSTAYKDLNRYLWESQNHDFVRGGTTAHNFHVDLEIGNAVCDLNIHEVNYRQTKWNMLNKLYLDPTQLGLMCARLLHYKNDRGYRGYINDIGMNFKERRNVSGACLMGMTIGYNHIQGWHCEVMSRASELTMRWYVDLIFIHVLLREIGKQLGFRVEDIKVYWRMVSTYQSITSMPMTVIMLGEEQWLIDNLPKADMTPEEAGLTKWQLSTIKRYRKSYIGGDYRNFKVQKRPVDLYRMMKGEMPYSEPVWTKDLQLCEIDLKHHIDFAEDEDNDMFAAGGYR